MQTPPTFSVLVIADFWLSARAKVTPAGGGGRKLSPPPALPLPDPVTVSLPAEDLAC